MALTRRELDLEVEVKAPLKNALVEARPGSVDPLLVEVQ